LVRRLGVTRDPQADQEEEALARHRTAVAALSRLEELVDLEAAPPTVAVRLRADLSATTAADYRRLRRELLAVEAAELLRLSETGQISEPVRRRLQRGLDLEEAALDD
jgi:CPA1 family monovalent cation:H+ antiporter